MLFTLYVAPLAKRIISQGVNRTKYADDVQLYTEHSDTKAILTFRDCFESMQHWLDLNQCIFQEFVTGGRLDLLEGCMKIVRAK